MNIYTVHLNEIILKFLKAKDMVKPFIYLILYFEKLNNLNYGTLILINKAQFITKNKILTTKKKYYKKKEQRFHFPVVIKIFKVLELYNFM